MRIAACFSGQVRTMDRCFASFLEHVKRDYDMDLFGYFLPCQDSQELLDKHFAKYVLAPDPPLAPNVYESRLGPGTKSVPGLLQQWHAIKRCNELRWEHEIATGTAYDIVIRTRPDIRFRTSVALEQIDPMKLYIPKFSNFGGYNDRFAVGGSRLMDYYSSLCDYVDGYFGGGAVFHAESMLRHHLDRLAVPAMRLDVLFDTVRDDCVIQPVRSDRYGDLPA